MRAVANRWLAVCVAQALLIACSRAAVPLGSNRADDSAVMVPVQDQALGGSAAFEPERPPSAPKAALPSGSMAASTAVPTTTTDPEPTTATPPTSDAAVTMRICGGLERLPAPAGLQDVECPATTMWSLPQLTYEGLPTLDVPHAVVLKGGDGVALVAHFAVDEQFGADAVRNVFALFDQRGDCTALIGEVVGPRRFVYEARSGGDTAAMLTGCASDAASDCPELVHAGGGVEPFGLGGVPISSPLQAVARARHELAVTDDGRIVVVSGWPLASGEGSDVYVRQFTSSLEKTKSVSSVLGVTVEDIAVTADQDLILRVIPALVRTSPDADYGAFQSNLVRDDELKPVLMNGSTQPGNVDVQGKRIAFSASGVDVFVTPLQTTSPVAWGTDVATPNGALDLTGEDELLHFVVNRGSPPALIRVTRDKLDDWTVAWPEPIGTTSRALFVDSAVQLQSDGFVLASAEGKVFAYCPAPTAGTRALP